MKRKVHFRIAPNPLGGMLIESDRNGRWEPGRITTGRMRFSDEEIEREIRSLILRGCVVVQNGACHGARPSFSPEAA